MDKQLDEIKEIMRMQTVRQEQALSSLQDIAGWRSTPEGDPGLCGLNCQLERLNDNLENLCHILITGFSQTQGGAA